MQTKDTLARRETETPPTRAPAVGAGASADAVHLPFGTYAPTTFQRGIIDFVRATPLHRGVFRDAVVGTLQRLRRGPIDWQTGGAAFRLQFAGNGTDIALLLKPQFDPAEVAFLSAVAGQGVFVDVGANIGAYTLLVAAATRGSGRVIAIEPLVELAEQVRANAAYSGFSGITVIEHAVGDIDGEVLLAVDAKNIGATSVRPHGTRSVRVRPLLDVLQEAGVTTVDALKIDVEGHEDRVLMPFFARAPRPLWPRRAVIEHLSRDDWREDCIEQMLALGYAIAGKTRSNTMVVRPGESS